MDYGAILDKYTGKRVFVTGNTGFKGSWLTSILTSAGAEVIGYALKPSTKPNLFEIAEIENSKCLHQIFGDVRDLNMLKRSFEEFEPEIVIHLAAQPIVRDSYKDPVTTYSTNVMGTVNILECVRTIMSVKSFLNVTTDKVYKNKEWAWGYRENDPLDGYDPYSNSKSCSELVTHSYKDSFFTEKETAISTARAGNVIGGGDFSNDRIIPDCVRTLVNSCNKVTESIIGVRNPDSIRPYQHVLEPLFAYLMIAIKQFEDPSYAGYYNVGPEEADCVTTGDLVSLFCKKWNGGKSTVLPRLFWEKLTEVDAPHEASFLKLDCSKIKARFGWRPKWRIDEALEQTSRWTSTWMSGGNVRAEMGREMEDYCL